MPIEEYPGNTGPRLIVREPTSPGAHVRITTDTMKLTASYQGGESNGYPALSPVMETLPLGMSRQITKERNDAELSIVSTCADGYLEQADLDRHILRIRGIVPVLSVVRVGESLQVVLPAYFDTTRYPLGRVLSYEIFN